MADKHVIYAQGTTNHRLGVIDHGIRGADIPSSGDAGPPPLYDDLSLPADNDVRFRMVLSALPSSGTLRMENDSSFNWPDDGESVADGSYAATGQRYRNGAADGSPEIITLTMGDLDVAAGTTFQFGLLLGLSDDTTLQAGLLQAVSEDTTLMATLLEALSKDTTLAAALLSAVEDDTALQTRLLGAVAGSTALSWDMLTLAGDVLGVADLRWALVGNVARSVNIAVPLVEGVSESTELRTTLLEAVSGDTNAAWALLEMLQVDTGLNWTMLSLVGDVIGSSDLRWGLREELIHSTALAQDLLTSVGIDANLAFTLLQGLDKELQLVHPTLAQVNQLVDTRWEILSIVDGEATLRWQLGAAPPLPGVAEVRMLVIPAQGRVLRIKA